MGLTKRKMATVLQNLSKARSLPLVKFGVRNFKKYDQDVISYPRHRMSMALKVFLFLPVGVFIWYPMVWFAINIRNFQHAKTWTWTGHWKEETKQAYRDQFEDFGKEDE